MTDSIHSNIALLLPAGRSFPLAFHPEKSEERREVAPFSQAQKSRRRAVTQTKQASPLLFTPSTLSLIIIYNGSSIPAFS